MRTFSRIINLIMVFALFMYTAWTDPSQAASVSQEGQDLPQAAQPVDDPLGIALKYLGEHAADSGLSQADLAEYRVTDLVTNNISGVTHVYLRQTYKGLDIFSGNAGVSILPEGQVLSAWNQFEPDVAGRVNTLQPSLTPEQAVQSAASALHLDLTEPLARQIESPKTDQAVTLTTGGISLESIPVRLVIHAGSSGDLHLAWDLSIYQLDTLHWWSLRIDATTGEMLEQDDFVDSESYTVYPIPVESPNHTTPAPPSDGRVTVNNPFNVTASPFGWHDTNGAAGAEFTTTQGNNVHAYTDVDANNAPDIGSSPDGGAGLVFNFPIDLTQNPSAYRPAAVTNLFYWNNIIHDVLYLKGFTEEAGNFQVNNYGRGGLGNDYVFAEAQDGSGFNNANFATPPDGSNPRMQMYVGNLINPNTDGDLDNLVIAHEYGHGVSNRLTGGPANVSCLLNSEQMGEGWSDFLGLALTPNAADTATTPRGVGTYLFGQPANGIGIRPAPYTRDMGVNAYTYTNLPSMAIPHGVGFVWSTMLWDMYWDLVDIYGFNPNLYAAWNTGGNNLAMQLVMDGMKIQTCSPGFVDGRDAILAADVALTGGVNQCTIWNSFARRGLGYSAIQGSSNSTVDGTAAFDIPISCQSATVSATPAVQNICVADTAEYTVVANDLFTGQVDFSAAGNPPPTTVSFNPDPDNSAPFVSTLTVGNTAGASAGTYELTIQATDGITSATTHVDLGLFSGIPAAPSLVSPSNGAFQVILAPTLEWSAAGNAISYTVEVATDAGFTNIVYAADSMTTTHKVDSPLSGSTQYYWRVTSNNPCGAGASSAPFHFTTLQLFCVVPGLAIPDNNPSGAASSQILPDLGSISDLNLWVETTHTWVGDLRITLTHDGATSVDAIDRPGVPASTFGCSNNDIDVILDDEGVSGPVESQCGTPGLFGNPTPNNPLSAFDGESTLGTWTLTATDLATGDTGSIQQWCIEAQASFSIFLPLVIR